MRQLIITPSQIGEIIRGRRKARNISQQELATKLHVSQSRLSTLEGNPGNLSLDSLIALANLLGFELVLQDKSDNTSNKAAW